MGPYHGPSVLILVLAILEVSFAYVEAVAANLDGTATKPKNGIPSMVATLCDNSGSPSVYLTPDNGWQPTDVGAEGNPIRTKGCLDSKEDLLKLCQMMYNTQNVTNIMEVENTIINHWPDRNGFKHSHNVTAYKCLIGPFESEALLVPQSCKFQHNKGPCGSLLYWKREAMASCEDMHMHERVYSILLPCTGHVAEFAGVEYVCCPTENIHAKPPVVANTPKPNKPVPHEVPITPKDAYEAYIQNDKEFLSRYRNEHAMFRGAMDALNQRHREQVTKMMKEWDEARRDIKNVKKTDQKGADKLYEEVFTRYQNLYQSYEETHASEKRQLVGLHLQHRQADLNHKKRTYLEEFMVELQKKNPNAHLIFQNLKDYLKVEEKDREHTVNHYMHVRDGDPEEAHRIQPIALEHLKVIDQRIQQSLDMLNKLPQYAKLVMPKIQKFREPFQAFASQALETLHQPLVLDSPKKKIDNNVNTNIDWNTPDNVQEEADDSEDENISEDVIDNATEDDRSYNDEIDEDEHKDIQLDVKPKHINVIAKESNIIHHAHAAVNKHTFEEPSVLSANANVQTATGSVFGIAIGSVAVFVIIVVAVIMLRKHSHRRPVTHGFVEVDPAASPEERHVANMQMNGYENPTYQYFELNQNQQQQNL